MLVLVQGTVPVRSGFRPPHSADGCSFGWPFLAVFWCMFSAQCNKGAIKDHILR